MSTPNVLQTIFSENFIDALGWTLVHSLWQGAIIAVGLALVLVFMRGHRSRARYNAGMAAMMLMLTVSLITFFLVSGSNGPAGAAVVVNAHSANSAGLIGGGVPQHTPGLMTAVSGFFKDYFYRHLPLIVTIWLMGVLVLMLRLTGGFLYQRRLKTRFSQPLPLAWQQRLAALGEKTGVKKNISLLESALIKAPVVIGFLKPVIMVPAGLVTGLPREQVEALLAHELAHIFRSDYAMNIIQNVMDMIYFYHPGLRWVSSMVRVERENCCDDVAAAVTGDSLVLAKALANIQSHSPSGAWNPEPAVAALSKPARLFNRVRRLLKPVKPVSRFREGLGGALLLLCCLFTLAAGIQAAVYLPYQHSEYTSGDTNDELNTDSQKEADTDKDADKNADKEKEIEKDIKKEKEKKKDKEKQQPKEKKKETEKDKEKALKKAKKAEEKKRKELKKKYEKQLKKERQKVSSKEKQEKARIEEQRLLEIQRAELSKLKETQKIFDTASEDLIKQQKLREIELLKLKKEMAEQAKHVKMNEEERTRELEKMQVELKKKVLQYEAQRAKMDEQHLQQREQELKRAKQEMARYAKELELQNQMSRKELQLREEELKKQAHELQRLKEEEMIRHKRELEKEHQRLKKEQKRLIKEEIFIKKLIETLINDKLIDNPAHLDLRLSKKAMYINGVKQPKNIFMKYKELIESNSGKLKGTSEFRIHRN